MSKIPMIPLDLAEPNGAYNMVSRVVVACDIRPEH